MDPKEFHIMFSLSDISLLFKTMLHVTEMKSSDVSNLSAAQVLV